MRGSRHGERERMNVASVVARGAVRASMLAAALASCAGPGAASSAATASAAPAGEIAPPDAPADLDALLGLYRAESDSLLVIEDSGRVVLLASWRDRVPLRRDAAGGWVTESGAAPAISAGAPVRFVSSRSRPDSLVVGARRYSRIRIDGEDGRTIRIVPQRPVEELRVEALAASPPAAAGANRRSDLVELVTLDSTIRLDVRYATTDNFMGSRMYSQPRAFLQRPAAEALVRAHRRLLARGYGLLVHDAYRPWYVTRMFWDATPDSLRVFVADPSSGSRHNRGAAVDLTLYDARTGRAVEMPSGYDEFSPRAAADFPGGTTRQRWLRGLLRDAMEREGFAVFPPEWWHFDHEGWRSWPIGNARFEELSR